MTDQHPLTNDKCKTVADSMTDFDGFPDAHDHMRAGADWQLEQVVEWLKDNLHLMPTSVDYIVGNLREAMRPTTTQEDNQ